MSPIRLAPVLGLLACMAVAGCQKHDDPIGTVPADDVPPPATTPAADPLDGAATPATTANPQNCDERSGAEREACLRGQALPPQPVEPQQSPSPAPVER